MPAHTKHEDLRVVKTRAAIYGAMKDLLNEMDYEDITVSLLAERANINRKTFYAHYSSMNDLLRELHSQALSEICEQALSNVGTTERPLESRNLTEELLRALNTYADDEHTIVKALGFETTIRMIVDPLEQGIRENLASRGIEPPAKLHVQVCGYLGALVAVFVDWRHTPDDPRTLDDLTDDVMNILNGRV